jgi:hypothetical protein
MSSDEEARWRRTVAYHVQLYSVPDYTAKGDAVVFFQHNAARALPVLEEMVSTGDDPITKMFLESVRQQLGISAPPAPTPDDEERFLTYVRHYLIQAERPEAAARDAANQFFQKNARRALPVLQAMPQDRAAVRSMLSLVQRQLNAGDNSFQARNPDLF